MIRASTLRFLMLITPPAAWMVVGFAASVLLGGITLWFNPGDVDSAFGGILLLQMFAVSIGFSGVAARGYLDPLLASGRSRQRIAIGSFVAAAVPGLFAWMSVMLMAISLGRAHAALAFHRHVALLLVSVVAWAGGLVLPRMAAGALWSITLIGAALSRGLFTRFIAVVQSPPLGVQDSAASALAFAMCPYLLLSDVPAAMNDTVIAIDLIAALVILWAAVRFLDRRDYPLVQPV